jgi:hypothetical protein
MNRSLRTHYHLRNKIFKDWYILVDQAVKHHRPDKPLEKCTIKIERLFFRFLDFDGCVASMKPIVDGLIHSDIIKDDSYKITGPWEVFQSFRSKKDGPLIKLEVQDGTN